MDYKRSKMLGDDGIRIPFNCDQGFEEYYLVYVGKTPYERERHLDKVVCARGPLSSEEHKLCMKTPLDTCWKDLADWSVPPEQVSKNEKSSLKDQKPKNPKIKKQK